MYSILRLNIVASMAMPVGKPKIGVIRRKRCVSQLVCPIILCVGFAASCILAVEFSVLATELNFVKSPDLANVGFLLPSVAIGFLTAFLLNPPWISTCGHGSVGSKQPEMLANTYRIATVSLYNQTVFTCYTPGEVIFTLLLMAGDVESNPGPVGSSQEKQTPSQETTPTRNPVTEHARVSKPGLVDVVQPFLGSTQPQKGRDTAFPEEPATKSADLELKVQQLEKKLQQAEKVLDEKNELLKVNEQLKNKLALFQKTQPQINQGWEAFRMGLGSFFLTELRNMCSTEETDYIDGELFQDFKAIHDTVYDKNGDNYETCMFEEVKHCSDKLQKMMGDFMEKLKSMRLWDESKGFLTDIPDCKVFFLLIVNLLYRVGGKCDICPLCGIKKKYRQNKEGEQDPDSHIIPGSCLVVYRDVQEGEGNFICNLSLLKVHGAKKLTFKLLCHKCESFASHAEQKLRDLYLIILSRPNERIEVPNESEWLTFIFGTIMFRGLLVTGNVDLMNEIRNRRFGSIRALLDLREYCREPQIVKPPPLYLSILPCGPFHPKLRDLTRIVDIQLRNPEFVSLIDDDLEGALYIKFDSFHCSLPFDDHSMGSINLSDKGKKIIPSEAERKRLFPELLLKRNFNEIPQLLKEIALLQPDFYDCKVFIRTLPSIFDQRTLKWPNESDQESSETVYQFEEKKGLSKEEVQVLIQEAAKASPLKATVCIDQEQAKLKKEHAQMQKCVRNLQSKLDTKLHQKSVERKILEEKHEEKCFKLKAKIKRKDDELREKNLKWIIWWCLLIIVFVLSWWLNKQSEEKGVMSDSQEQLQTHLR